MAGNRLTLPVQSVYDLNGAPFPGGKLSFFDNNTTTAKETFSDVDLTVSNPQPVIADGAGRFGNIFLANSSYRVQLTDENDVLIWSRDDVNTPIITTVAGNYPLPGAVSLFFGTQLQLDVFLASGWFVMDGNNGTNNLDQLFLRMTTNVGGLGITGGSDTVTPTGTVEGHVLTIAEIPPHTHPYGNNSQSAVNDGGSVADAQNTNDLNTSSTGGGDSHDHALTMDVQTNLPPFFTLIPLIFQGS